MTSSGTTWGDFLKVMIIKNRGNPKMDGENNGTPENKMDDLGVPSFLETPISKDMFLSF